MAKKRVTRKQLLKEPDEFLTFSRKLFNFCVEHANYLMIGFGAVVALILLISGMRYLSKQSEIKAFTLLDEATKSYNTLKDEAEGSETDIDALKDRFALILDKYAGKDAGKLARITLADICFQKKEFDRAADLYRRALDDFETEPLIKYRLLEGLGYAYAGKQDFENAAKYFEMIVAAADAPAKDEALFNLAGLYDAMTLGEKSRQTYQKIVSDHQDSMYRNLAEEKIADL